MTTFQMTRIELPDWARRPDAFLQNMRLSDYHAIQIHRQQMLEIVQREVEAYMNTPSLYYEGDEDGFPNRSWMSGEYYVEHESYEGNLGWFQVGVQCHCLGKPPLRPEFRDYLGLHVWLRCDPSDWSFAILGNTDSSSI